MDNDQSMDMGGSMDNATSATITDAGIGTKGPLESLPAMFSHVSHLLMKVTNQDPSIWLTGAPTVAQIRANTPTDKTLRPTNFHQLLRADINYSGIQAEPVDVVSRDSVHPLNLS